MGGAHGSLAVVRSLGRRGIPVVFVTDDHPIAGFSRYARATLSWAGPDRDDAVRCLIELAARHGLQGWVLFAGGDPEVRLISQAHAELSATFRLTTPPWPMVRLAYDKRLMHEQAASVGIGCAWTYYPRDRQDVAAIACPFPVILKPTAREQRNDFTSAKAWRVDDRRALLAAYDRALPLVGAGRVMLQEFIPGTGAAQFSYAAVWNREAAVMSVVARRTRQFPIDFGFTSTFVETIENAQVEDAACRLLRSLRHTGLAEVEFKYDSRERSYKILDVNLRAWTWCALGDAAGVDFPYAAWQLAIGEVPKARRGRAGVAWRHTARDLAAGIQELRRGTITYRDYIRAWRRPTVFAAYAADDPVPGLLEVPVVTVRVLMRRLPRLARAARWCGARLQMLAVPNWRAFGHHGRP